MSKKYMAPLPMSARDIRQDMIGLLTQSCQMKPSRALSFARELAAYIFKLPSPKDRSLRWWACKCAINAANSPGIQVGHTLETAAAILVFLAEEVEDDFGFDLDAEPDPARRIEARRVETSSAPCEAREPDAGGGAP